MSEEKKEPYFVQPQVEMRKVLTREEMMLVECPTCDAGRNRNCHLRGRIDKPLLNLQDEPYFHPTRIVAAQQAKANCFFSRSLSATDKSLIIYYAFIQLCDSVSVKSKEVLGVEKTSEDIQRFFAQTAIKELRKDGLLG